jgi:S-adenosylmethionine:tRNA ribosyltransferase-isomerase
MIAADRPIQRSARSRLLHVDREGRLVHVPRRAFVDLLRPGDVVVANDAATLPASLSAIHVATGEPIEVRLAGRASLRLHEVQRFVAVVFGAGDYRTRTEDRAPPPTLRRRDVLRIGTLSAVIEALLEHPRLARLRFEADAPLIWKTFASVGKPIQYAHLTEPLQLWDAWTPIAAVPVAYEPPSAGFMLDWQTLAAMRTKGARFVTLTHAAGISSTGDAELDRRFPLDEPYFIPTGTVAAIEAAKASGRRVIAIGTTVVRALEHAASAHGELHAGEGIADQRLSAATRLRVVDAIVSGTHESGSSHYELLHAFVGAQVLKRLSAELDAAGYLTHEFGDSVFIEAAPQRMPRKTGRPPRQESTVARKPAVCVACLR